MTKRRLSYEGRRRKSIQKEEITSLISSVQERTGILNTHIDEVLSKGGDPLLFTEHLDRYIGNLILFNNRLKEIVS